MNRRRTDSAVLVLAVGAGAALTFAFHAVAGRLLEPHDYSGLGALLSILAALGVPLTAVQVAVTRETASTAVPASGLGRRGRTGVAPVAGSGRRVLRHAAFAATAVGALGVVASPLVATYLRLDSPLPVVVAAGWLALNGPAAVARGLLIGAREPRPVAAAIVSTGIARIVAAAALAPTLGLAGAVAASVVAEAVGCAVVVAASARAGLLESDRSPIRARVDDTGRAVRLQVLLWVGAGAAPVLARRVLDEGDLGSFAAMATAASACLFLPQAVATLVLPRFVADGSWRGLRRALAAALATSLLGAAPTLVLPGPVFALLFGPGYEPDRAVLGLLCLTATGFGALAVVSQFTIARRLPGSAVVAVGVVATVVAAEVVAAGPTVLAALLLGASWPAVAVLAARARSGGPIGVAGAGPATPAGPARTRSAGPLLTGTDVSGRAA